MSAIERFIRYAKIDTQSDPNTGKTPSTDKQWDLANLLVQELLEMGVEDAMVSEHGYVYAHLPSNQSNVSTVVGWIAHMDTAPDYSGTGVHPRIIESYDGKDIPLCEGVTTKVEDFPLLKNYVGETLIVTNGSTLLGADDKAGITAIMEAIQYFLDHPEVPHGKIAIAFTPDEEIGEGTKYFDYERFGANFAYTMDGGEIHKYADETFNAAAAHVEIQGFSIHPGSAKDRMINAASIASELHQQFPGWMRPEHTTDHEGFFHLMGMQGNVDHASMDYILRDHDLAKLEEKKDLFRQAVAHMNQIYGEGVVQVEIKDSYQNMKNILKDYPEIATIALSSMEELGMKPEYEVVRGGTDGAQLTYHGLPCPNLGTGGGNAHGRYEYLVVSQLEQATDLIVLISKKVAQMK